MRLVALATLLAMTSVAGAVAQETTIIRRDAPVGTTTVIDADAPRVVEKRTIESTGGIGGCETKTVSKSDEDGNSKTVTKRSCD